MKTKILFVLGALAACSAWAAPQSINGAYITAGTTQPGSLAAQSANTVVAGPTSGSAATPTARTLGLNDMPAGVEQTANKNTAGGYAGLDSNGYVAIGQTNPAIGITIDNRLVNPEFAIDQKFEGGANTPSSTGVHITDGWTEDQTQASKFQFNRSTGSPPTGVFYSELITVAASVTSGATDEFTLVQKILGADIADFTAMGTANAPTLQLEFYAKSSVAGTYCAYLHNNGNSRAYVVQYVIGSTGTWYDFQYTVPGDTSGTWNSIGSTSAYGFKVGFDLGSGSNFQTTAATWGAGNFTTTSACTLLVATNAATMNIARVRLYPSTVPLAYVQRPYASEMQSARRFFQKSFTPGVAPAQGATALPGSLCTKNPIATGDPSAYIQFSPPFIVGAPALTTYNPSQSNANWRDITAAADVTVSADPGTSIGAAGVLVATSGTVTTLGDVLCIGWSAVKDL